MRTMTMPETHTNQLNSSTKRKLGIAGITFLVLAMLIGAVSIPFLFESPSIKYKFGWDKVMLRAGKIVGLTAAVLLSLQLPLAGHFKFLDNIFSLPIQYRIHRINAYLIGVLILIHPILVFLPEGRLMIPLEARYWPEWLGLGLLLIILGQILVSRWRRPFIKHYPLWLFMHRFMGAFILVILVIHVLYVSETFEYNGLPRNAVFLVAGLLLFIWVAIRAQRLLARRKLFKVSNIESAGKDAYAIDIVPVYKNGFQYIPGQFAFFSFISKQITSEWHPFTISSSPTRPDNIQITVRSCGDWTDQISKIQKGDHVYVHGPFGKFSHLFESKNREVIMIAGGIGITPMLSMLREMHDKEDSRRISLLWSNQTARYEFNREELQKIAEKLNHFSWTPIFTDKQEPYGEFGRLTLSSLRKMIADCSRNAVVFLCGPPMMIQSVRRYLISLGFPKKSIREELFGL